LRTCTSLIVL
jgi:hypothetical protein